MLGLSRDRSFGRPRSLDVIAPSSLSQLLPHGTSNRLAIPWLSVLLDRVAEWALFSKNSIADSACSLSSRTSVAGYSYLGYGGMA